MDSVTPEVADVGGANVFLNEFDSDVTARLGDYLSRPVKIDSFTWAESDTFSTSPHYIYPWYLYFNSTYIKPKLQNFSRLSCKLKITVRFSASPFYYGLMRMVYDPLVTDRLHPISSKDMIVLSQAPGVYMAPQNTSVVEMELPFVWPGNWLNISKAAEFLNMGELQFNVFNQLKSANGVTGSGITVTVYAHAEDVQIAGPTSDTVLQSGVVSGPATTVANIARMVTKAPVIGPFARAIDMGASAVAGIAKLFGFSNAPIISDVTPVQPKAFHAMANVETSVPLDKLSLDPDNSVTIDNTVTGFGSEDPLAIIGLATRESYLAQTDWVSGDTEGTKLMAMAITPNIIDSEGSVGSSNIIRMSPSAWVSSLFRFWRGSMVIKIKLVKSVYHKGRLIIHWDPQKIPSYGTEAAVFTQIIDLADEGDEYEIVIPYKARTPMLVADSESNGIAVRGNPNVNLSLANGFLAIYVQNVLSGPTVAPVVGVLVYSKTGQDIQFAGVDRLNQNQSLTAIQSGTIDGSTISVDDKVALITCGETIASLRSILHRASLSYSQPVGGPLGPGGYATKGHLTNMNIFPRLPPDYGFYAEGLSWANKVVGAGASPFNFATTHPINFVLAAFVGYRGSTNVFVNVTTIPGVGAVPSISISRAPHTHIVSLTSQSRNRWTVTTNGADATIALRNCQTASNIDYRALGATGTSLTNQFTQAGVNVNVPQYSYWRFQPAFTPVRDIYPDHQTRTSGTRLYDNVRVDTNFTQTSDAVQQVWPVMDVYYSAGVDFQPVWFVGVPRFYAYGPPTVNESLTPT